MFELYKDMSSDGATFLDGEVLPTVFDRLDSVFPEFGWKKTRGGWVATNGGFTREKFSARPDRVVCKENVGFLVYGDRSYHWLEYLSGGIFPRGPEWWRVVGALALRVGLSVPARQKRPVRERALEALRAALRQPPSVAAYLHDRVVEPGPDIGELDEPTAVLAAAGFSREEVGAAGLGRDSRWAGRVCCIWRDAAGRPTNMWGRALDGAEPKYLVLAGEVPPVFGAEVALAAARRGRCEEGVVVVEGMFDVLSLRARGVEHYVGVGRAGVSDEAFRLFEAAGAVTLMLDDDDAGEAGTWKAVERWATSRSPVRLYVVPRGTLGGAKDPDELVRRDGIDALAEVIRKRKPAASAYAERAVARATTEAEVQGSVAKVIPFLADVAICHPVEAAAASEVLARHGVNAAMLKLLTKSLGVDELRRMRDSLARRLAEVDELLDGFPGHKDC